MATTTATNQGSVPLIIVGPAYLSQFQNQFPVTKIAKEFPVRTLKVLGSVQIGLGVVLGILSIVGIVLDVIGINRDCDTPYYSPYWMCPRQDQYRNILLAFDITCLVLSGWYIMTGFLPLCMSRKRESSWGRLRIGFMVCSIIGASIFVPTMFSLGVNGGLMRGIYDQGRVTVLSAFMAALSFAEFVVSIIGASYCCCCTPWQRTDQTHCCMPKRNVGQASQEQEPQQSNSDTADRLATTTYISQGAVPLDVQEPAYLLQCINQPPASGNTKEFPVRTLKVLGSVQIGLGIVLGVWSIVGVILDVISMLKECKQYDVDILYKFPAPNYLCKNWAANSYKVFAFDITCLVFSGWYVLTGFLPLRMSRKIESSSDGLRVGYMVCSIIGASILAPTMFILGVVGAIMREGYEKDVIVLSAFMAVLSFAELVVSIIGASYCCCCIPWKETYQSIRVVYAPHPVMICNLPQSQIPTTTDQPNRLNAVGQSDNQIVQYPRTQQYHVIATNTLLTSPIQPAASA